MLGHDTVPEQGSEQGSEQVSERVPGQVSEQQGLAPETLSERVQELVSRSRFEHIERVVTLATAIAESNGFGPEDLRRVALAALLHDSARDLPDERLLELASPANEVEAEHPLVLHGRAARRLAHDWGVDDEVVLGAIEGHVFGVPVADLVGMAVYVADVSEPGRGVNRELRELAMEDLPAAYRDAVKTKVEYLRASGKAIHPATLRAYRSLGESTEPADAQTPSPRGESTKHDAS